LEFGNLEASFVWNGEDVEYEVETPSPDATLPPTVEPGSSLITIQFVSGGQPIKMRMRAASDYLSGDGSICLIPITGEEALTDHDSKSWPFKEGVGQPNGCSKGPPTVVTFRLNTQFGPLRVDVLWTGSDVFQMVDVTSMLPTPSPTPSAAPSPAQLPQSGGGHPDGRMAFAEVAIVVAIMSAEMAVWILALRTKLRE
jgi:hypothetical protein